MSAVVPYEIVNRLHTETCDCANLEELRLAYQTAKSKSVSEYVSARYNYVCKYINLVFIHTAEPLVDDKPCRRKDFVLTNDLRKALIEHFETLNLITKDLEKDEVSRRPFLIIFPQTAANLLQLFGYPGLTKSVQVHEYMKLMQRFLSASIQLHEKLVQPYTATNPSSLLSFLKLETLSLRIFQSWSKVKQNGGSNSQPSNQNGPSQLADPSNTSIGTCET